MAAPGAGPSRVAPPASQVSPPEPVAAASMAVAASASPVAVVVAPPPVAAPAVVANVALTMATIAPVPPDAVAVAAVVARVADPVAVVVPPEARSGPRGNRASSHRTASASSRVAGDSPAVVSNAAVPVTPP